MSYSKPQITNGTNGIHHPPATSLLERTVSSSADILDAFVPPNTRVKIWNEVKNNAASRPLSFSFLSTLILFSLFPILLFILFTLTTLIFALISALVFTAFCAGFAILILVPALFFAGAAAVACWCWVVGGLFCLKWGMDVWDGVTNRGRKEKI